MKKLDIQLQLCLGILTTKIFAKYNSISIFDYLKAASDYEEEYNLGAFPFYLQLMFDGLPQFGEAWLISTRDLGFDNDWFLCAYTKECLGLPQNAKILNTYKILAPNKQWSSCEDYIQQNRAFITDEAYKNYCDNIENIDSK